MSNVNKVKLLSERTSGVPPVIFSVAFCLNSDSSSRIKPFFFLCWNCTAFSQTISIIIFTIASYSILLVIGRTCFCILCCRQAEMTSNSIVLFPSHNFCKRSNSSRYCSNPPFHRGEELRLKNQGGGQTGGSSSKMIVGHFCFLMFCISLNSWGSSSNEKICKW